MPPFEQGKSLRSANDNADPSIERAVLFWRQILADHWPTTPLQGCRSLFSKLFSVARGWAATKLD
jgi:hypothetical protein